MLDKIKRFFQAEEKEEKKSVVEITVYADENLNPYLDIELEEYSDKTIKGLCNVLDVLSGGAFYIQVISMIQKCMKEDKEDEQLLKVLTHVANQNNSILANQEQTKDEPCIKPSEMVQ